MPRKKSVKPWLHRISGYWCATNAAGKRVYLDLDYKVACRKLLELRAKEQREIAGGKEWLDAPFANLANEYLTDLQKRRKPGTYRATRYRLLRALKLLGTTLRVGEVRKIHVARMEQAMVESYSPTTIADTITALNSIFCWAIRFDLLETNPIAGYAKPARRSRHRIIQHEEFQALLRNSDPLFRCYLVSARLTGCRPGELRSLIWEWVDLENGLWIFPDHKTITMQRNPRPRIVPLPTPVWKLCQLWHRTNPEPSSHVFLNMHGQPYTKDCLVLKMKRVRERAGIVTKANENLVLYSARHTYATKTVGKVSDLELATLMGHTSTHMIRRYVHLNAEQLREIQRRAE